MRLPYIIALVGVGAISLGAAAFASNLRSESKPAATVAKVDTSPMPVPQRHTLEDLLKLEDGISYDDAARTLGTVGHAENKSASGLPGAEQDSRLKVYAWPNPDGSRVILSFQDDRLVHRTHVGLR
ncbi:MAG TPA: hypothetical protein VNZ50_10295 [Hyphomicrobiaceae bacterium]|jgi:hypothetical protein|nr:hypothetical protein [Hyphomicrobiaceae bacterium]